jgi:ArsR family transcriptional regulator
MNAVAQLAVRSPSKLFKALGDPNRLRIVALLSQAELCVCHIEAALELPQPTVSRHLAVLRNAGVVESERQGGWVFYRIARQTDAVSRRQLRGLLSSFRTNGDLKGEVAHLLRSKGPDACR